MSEGENQQPQRYCKNCGAEARAGTSFCVSCGVPFTQAGASVNPASSEATTISSPFESLVNTVREQFQGLRDKFTGSSGRATAQQLPSRVINWFRELSSILKLIVVGLILLIPFVLLSPVMRVVAIIALAASIVILLVQGFQRKPIRVWAVSAVSSLVLIFVLGGISNAIYGPSFGEGNGYDGSSETASDSDPTGSASPSPSPNPFDSDDNFNQSYEEADDELRIAQVNVPEHEAPTAAVAICRMFNYSAEYGVDPVTIEERVNTIYYNTESADYIQAADIANLPQYEEECDRIWAIYRTVNE